jgi:hypothetical protein
MSCTESFMPPFLILNGPFKFTTFDTPLSTASCMPSMKPMILPLMPGWPPSSLSSSLLSFFPAVAPPSDTSASASTRFTAEYFRATASSSQGTILLPPCGMLATGRQLPARFFNPAAKHMALLSPVRFRRESWQSSSKYVKMNQLAVTRSYVLHTTQNSVNWDRH